MYYFDRLSVRPAPRPYESISSYATRLMHENGIYDNHVMDFILFNSSQRFSDRMKDLPFPDFTHFAQQSSVNEARLKEATFYYLLVKFGKSASPRAANNFLKGAICDVLRFCPICVKDKGYYSLLWRFELITHCLEHQCKLESRCSSCRKQLPFLTLEVEIGYCVFCNNKFYDAYQVQYTPGILDTAISSRYNDFSRLLAQSCDTFPSAMEVKKLLGREFMQRRRSLKIPRFVAASELSLAATTLRQFEVDANVDQNLSFQRLLEYGHYLGIDIIKLVFPSN